MNNIFSSLSDFLVSLILSRWFWIVLLIVIILIFLALSYRKLKIWALGRLQYNRHFSTDGVFVGEGLELIENITNPVWFPLFSIHIDFFMPSGLTIDELKCVEYTKVTSIFYIPPFSTVQKKHSVIADKRDHYKLSTAKILYKKNEFIFSDELDFYAYPDIYNTKVSLSSDIYYSGNVISNKKYIEDPFFISGISPYYHGAPMKSINFKVSARSFSGGIRQLVCNNYDSSRNYDSMIFLNLSSYSDVYLSEEEQLETGLRYACYLFCEALKNSGNVGFGANCSNSSSKYIYLPCTTGDLHTKSILEAFAEITTHARRDYSMSAIFKKVIPTLNISTDIFLITPPLDTELSKDIWQAEQMGYAVYIIPLDIGRDK